MTEIQNFVKQHNDWEAILSGAPYYLKITRDSGYVMFKYNQLHSDFSIPLVREARGIIFYEADWTCVCHAMDKFGNYGESYCPDIDWDSISVQEKVDGSLIKLWYHNGWHFSTNSTIYANEAKLNDAKYSTFMDLIIESFKFKVLEYIDPACTYWFELVSPYNRVVIPYDDIKMYFLGWRDNKTGIEHVPEDSVCARYFDMPKRFPMRTLNDIKTVADVLDWDKEGFVVCDRDFNRVKIKSPAYVMAHFARNNNVMTTKRLIDVILAGEQSEFLCYAQDYAVQLADIEASMLEIKAKLVRIAAMVDEHKHLSAKEFAELIQDMPGWICSFAFKRFRANITVEAFLKTWTAQKWAGVLEKGNYNA